MICKICGGNSLPMHQALVLGKYKVDYFKCGNCNFTQTQKPIWLEEDYQSAITGLDIGLVNRNLYLVRETPAILNSCFPDALKFLDYGGGFGLYVRMMRDEGFNFFRQDYFCENIFAKHFDVTDLPDGTVFDLVTAFEVFEHLEDPIQEIERIFKYSKNILFSTVIAPEESSEFKNWWYVSPETGQHISFYSLESLEYIAQKFNLNFYSNGVNLHLLSTKKMDENLVAKCFRKKAPLVKRVWNRLTKGKINQKKSLLEDDYELLLKELRATSKEI